MKHLKKLKKRHLKYIKRMAKGKRKEVKEVILTSTAVKRYINFECGVCGDMWSSLTDKNNSCPQCGTRDKINKK